MAKAIFLGLSHFSFAKIPLTKMTVAKTHSTLLSALRISLPIPKTEGIVILGAVNFNQASMKLMPHTNPVLNKVEIRDMELLTTDKPH